MPRQARKKSESGIYHIMLRGIDRQQIFEDVEDSNHFLTILQDCRELCQFKLYAYCLMGNHVHLLIKAVDRLDTIFKKICGRYVYYFNVKYQRVGHLFQDRFRSEPIDDDAYFLTVLRYIHQNPIKAKMCKSIEDYPYSSYMAYLSNSETVDTEFALGMIDLEEFAAFNKAQNSDECLEVSNSNRGAVTDTQAKVIIEKISKTKTTSEFQCLDSIKREKFTKKIYEKGVSVRQISRLTGITKGMVEKYLKS